MLGFRAWIGEVWQRSMLHRALLVAPPVALFVLAGLVVQGTRPRVEYYTRAVDLGPIEQVVQATGTINAVTTVQVGSQVSGNIAELFADFNSKVTKGQVIAQIDPSTFRARMQQAEADLENARANRMSLEAQIETQRADVAASRAAADRARAQLREAELQLKRTQELAEQGILSVAQKDTAEANRDSAAASLGVAQAQLQQSQARLKATQAQLEQAKAQVAQRRAAAQMAHVDLSHATIRAPIDGTVIARNVDVGQTVAASLQAPTLFVIAQDLTRMLVYAKTDEADVGKIRLGARARFRVDSFPRRTFSGRVTQVRMNATTVQNVVTYDTIIEFHNDEQMLFPGMTAYVTIPIEAVDEALRIPNGALRFKPEISEEERRKLFAKYSIPSEEPNRRSEGAGAANPPAANSARNAAGEGAAPGRGAAAGGAGSRMEGGRPGGAGGEWRRRSAGESGAGPALWAVVWKEGPGRSVVPVRVKLGVTDFTFTEMKEGALKAGDKLIIGQSSGKAGQASRTAPQGPMGGPGGMPRRM